MSNLADEFRKVIEEQRVKSKREEWSGNSLDYLTLVKENPDIATFAAGRVYNAIMKYGVTELDDSYKTRGYEDIVKYNYFDGKIFGCYESIHDIMRFLRAAARRTETGRRILILVGPVSSGKSSFSAHLKRAIEIHDTEVYTIDGCPIHEDPLHLIPEQDREHWEEVLGVKINGHLCPVCQRNLETEWNGEWENAPVKKIHLNEKKRIGIGTFQPSDPKSQDVTELIGRINMSKMTRFGETDPRAYQFDGEMQIANRGIVEMIELLKVDTKLQYVLLTAAQEQLIKSPGFPQMYIDTLILAHTNQTEYDAFAGDKKNEALHSRMYPVKFPWNVRLDDEVKIYEKLIKESDFKDVHIAPHTLKVAAMFAIMTRLVPSSLVNLVDKLYLYNNEYNETFKKEEIDLKRIRQEGRDKGEGMSGIDPRFIMNALNIAIGRKENKNCINPIDVIRALVDNFEHSIGISEEDQKRYIHDILGGDKDSVRTEFNQIAKKEVNMAFINSYDDHAQGLFENYIKHARAWCKKEFLEDDVTGESIKPDEKLMTEIEEVIGLNKNARGEFRRNIFVFESDAVRNGRDFTYKDYPPLEEAIEKKLLADLRQTMTLTLTNRTPDKREQGRKKGVINRLMRKGYCEECAYTLVNYVADLLRKENG